MKNRVLALSLMLMVFPTSTNYVLKGFSTNAGGDNLTSAGYSLEAVAGEQGNNELTSSSYKTWPGLLYTQIVNTPSAPTVTNDGDYTNKLLIKIDSASNPTDTKFAIAISDDNFVSTEYVQSDNTLSPTLGAEDWQTYTDWGDASGEFAIGLVPNTTYYFKTKGEQGEFTEGPWGPVSSVATSSLSISFDIDVSATDQETAAPYALAMGDLSVGSVVTSTEKVWVDLATNAPNGGFVYVFGTNGGLYSSRNNYTISAVSGNLSSLSEGFGLQYDSLSQAGGGPMAVSSPYDGAGEVVGTVDTNPQEIFTTTSAPISGGRASFVIKAKINDLTPASADYTDTITIISAASF